MNFAKVTKSNDVKGARVGKIFPMLSKKSGWVKFTLDSGEEAKLRSGSVEVIEAESLEVARAQPEGGAFARLKAARVNYVRAKEGGDGEPKRLRVDCGDEVAEELRPLTLEKVYATVAKGTGATAKSLHEKYNHLNLGQQRMNLGNMLRRARREAEAAE